MKNRPLPQRLGFAASGILIVWRRERSFRAQSACALAAIAGLALLGAPPVWDAIVVLASALVLALELMNSALEYAIDLLHPAIAEEIRHAKDAAAGAVLVASLGTLVIAALLALARAS